MGNVAEYALQAIKFNFANAQALDGGSANNKCICGGGCRFGNKDPANGVVQSWQGGLRLLLPNRRRGRAWNYPAEWAELQKAMEVQEEE